MVQSAHSYHATALVLSQTKLGETDVILTMLSSTGQQIRAVAKGGRKPGSKLAGKVRVFSLVEGLFARGKNLDILTEAKLAQEPFSFEGELLVLSAASAIANIVRLLSYPDAQNPFLWGATVRVLGALQNLTRSASYEEKAPRSVLLLVAHTFKILSHEGWQPLGLTRAPKTQSLIDLLSEKDGDHIIFSAEAGGFFDSLATAESTLQISLPASFVHLISFLIGTTYDEIEDELARTSLHTVLSWGDLSNLTHACHVWASSQLDARLKSFEYLEKLLI